MLDVFPSFTVYNLILFLGEFVDFFDAGCSEELGDMKANILFEGDIFYEYTNSLTSYALVSSNLTDGISMFDGFGDADNDGTNNVNDLDNAGSFMPFLVKTHESATSAFFRFDFNSDNIRIWKKDGTMTRTNSTDSIQDGHNYSYNDLFADGAERTFYVQGIESGEHSIDVTYILDGEDLDSKDVSFSFISIGMTSYRPQTEGVGYGNPFQKHEVPDELELSPGVGIRYNGDDDNSNSIADKNENLVNGENDLIELELTMNVDLSTTDYKYVLERSNNKVQVWSSSDKSQALFNSSETKTDINLTSSTLWGEAVGTGEFNLKLGSCKRSSEQFIMPTQINFYTFNSIVVTFEGEGGDPADPPAPGLKGMGISVIALNLYTNGYDVHNYVDSPTTDAYNEILNAVSNRCVEQIALIGYSHGGGTVYNISESLDNDSIDGLKFTAYIDAIKQALSFSETRRPLNSSFHVNYFQEAHGLEIALEGTYSSPSNNCFQINVDENVNTESHLTIDDSLSVQNSIINYLMNKTER